MQGRFSLWVGVLSAAASLSSACGSSPSLASQLAPSGSTTLSSVAIAMSTPAVGGSAQATGTATFSNGSTSPIATGFTSDAPGVATVTAAGLVTGVAIGDATISVDYQGMRASKKVHVLPGYAGTFIGSYSVSACAETGDFSNTDPTQDFCSVFTVGAVGGIAIQATQSSDLTSMTANFLLGALGVQGTGTGTVSPVGTLTFAGTLILGTTRVGISGWTATSPSPGRITGSFTMTFTDSTMAGSGIVTATNLDMTRQAAALSTSALPHAANSDWRSLIVRPVRHR